MSLVLVACLGGAPGCGSDASQDTADAATGTADAATSTADAATATDAATGATDAATSTTDAATSTADAATSTTDAATSTADAATSTTDAATGVITGGPCMSGATGAAAYRIRWAGNGSGSTAYVVYEVNGLPDTSRDKAGAYGYQIGFTPSFVDTFLAQGGLQLNSSSFVDIDLSTVGVSQIDTATLAVYGRSYNTTTSGSFNWQTFSGTGAAPTNLVSNAAPYQWYSADMTTEIDPGDGNVKLRIKAGPSSGSLVVNRVELCLQAE